MNTSVHFNREELEAVIAMVEESGNEILTEKLELMKERLEKKFKESGPRVLSNIRTCYRGSQKIRAEIKRITGEELIALVDEGNDVEIVDPESMKVRVVDEVINEDKVKVRTDIQNRNGSFRSVYGTIKSDKRDQFIMLVTEVEPEEVEEEVEEEETE